MEKVSLSINLAIFIFLNSCLHNHILFGVIDLVLNATYTSSSSHIKVS